MIVTQFKVGYISKESQHCSSVKIIGDVPCISDLQMTHHSDMCVLLRWSPPTALHSSSPHCSAKKLGYRVFINGTAEGMVRPQWIECLEAIGLEHA